LTIPTAGGPGIGDFSYSFGQWPAGFEVLAADMDGDGTTDLFGYNAGDGAWQRCLGGDLAEAESFRCSGSVWPRNLSAFPADFDADGAADLLLFDRATGAWTRATSDGVGVTITETPGAWPAGNWQVVPGDFDGDGRSSDFLLYDQETGNVRLELDSGSGFEASAGQAAWSPGWQVLAGDFNADGRTDVLLYAAGQGRTSVGLTGQAGDFGWTSETLPADGSLIVRDLNDDERWYGPHRRQQVGTGRPRLPDPHGQLGARVEAARAAAAGGRRSVLSGHE